jgi:hypothetical protein
MDNQPTTIGTPQFKRKDLVFKLLYSNIEEQKSLDTFFLTKIAYMNDQELYEFYNSYFKKSKR